MSPPDHVTEQEQRSYDLLSSLDCHIWNIHMVGGVMNIALEIIAYSMVVGASLIMVLGSVFACIVIWRWILELFE